MNAIETMQQGASAGSTTPENALEGLLWSIGHRRSLGLSRLKQDEVDKDIIQAMLTAANWGMSNDDTEPWRFAVFTGEGREKLTEIFQNSEIRDTDGSPQEEKLEGLKKRAYAAPAWIAIGMSPKLDADGNVEADVVEEQMAVATAVQNMALVAGTFGLVGMWHSKGVSVHPEVGNQLGWSDPSKLLGFFFCGWPNVSWPAGERGSIDSRVQWFS